ncbi:MAG: 30S ribosomal protein S17 [Spirochaetes bacterium]|nr:30S ribosomal protein S17 [Spirochaetota bacterium]
MSEQATQTKRAKKTAQGVVVSAKTPKTIVVEIAFRKQDAHFKKTIRQTKKIMAHDENTQAKEGDTVVIEESRPHSKRKRFALQKIVTRKAEDVPVVG